MPRKRAGETSPRSKRQLPGLPVIRRNVAGIDLGSERHWVCAPTHNGSDREIADFGATTPELIRLAEWLKARQIESVAMESTGVYWIAPHEVLEAQGLKVLLVDTRQLAQVPGRDPKTDPTDCEWIQRLHSCGLLRASFRPEQAICMLRTLIRDKATLVAESADWLRRMQKSLDQMNVRVHRAVADIDGVTGMAILRAIAEGERDAEKLAKLRIWSGFEPLPHREAVRLPCDFGAACGEKRRPAGQKAQTEPRQHARRLGFVHGGTLVAPRRERIGSVLSETREAS
jgi:transposase